MYLNNGRHKFWQWAVYLAGGLGGLYCGWFGYSHNLQWLIIAFQFNVWIQIALVGLSWLCAFSKLPEEEGKYIESLRENGHFCYDWLEYLFEAGYVGLLLYFQHPIIAAVYLFFCILQARIRFEVRRQTYLATIKYKKTVAE